MSYKFRFCGSFIENIDRGNALHARSQIHRDSTNEESEFSDMRSGKSMENNRQAGYMKTLRSHITFIRHRRNVIFLKKLQ